MPRRQLTTGCVCEREATRAEDQGLPDVARIIRENCAAGRAHIRSGTFPR